MTLRIIRHRRPAGSFNLDQIAERDRDAFVAQYPESILSIDEVQRVPGLMTSRKANVDSDRCPDRFLNTGSAELMTLSGSQKSLAERAEKIQSNGLSHLNE